MEKLKDSKVQPSEKVGGELTFLLGGLQGGGAERVATLLIDEWLSKGVSINLITMRGPEKDAHSLPMGVNRIILGGEGESKNKFTALIKNFIYLFKVRKAIRQTGGNTVISFLTRANIYAILACFGLKKHLIISERNDTTRQTLDWPWKALREKLYKHADVVTANSHIALESMKEYVPETKLKKVPNPLNIPDIENISVPEKSNIILNVARLTAHKRQSLLIDSVSLLHDSFELCSLVILGEGEERSNLEEQADRLNIDHQVTMPGYVQNVSEYYKNAAMFILPSEYEGTPNVLLEAMAHGLPCIVSDSLPGALELMKEGDSGLVFKSNDPGDLRDKIRLLIENPDLRAKMGMAGREAVSEFSTEKVVRIWEENFV
ncbi:MAG: glycosyltransferase [Balneolaceae bacterium]|nr:glycosyltransferase [Balneolaceae bacterium]